MNEMIQDGLRYAVVFSACTLILGLIVFVNYVSGSDKLINRTVNRHN
jgi:hypothetical protein